MATMQITTEEYHALEGLLKKTIQENQKLAKRYPTTAARLNKDTVLYEQILSQLLLVQLLSDPRPEHHNPQAINRVPEYARPKFQVA